MLASRQKVFITFFGILTIFIILFGLGIVLSPNKVAPEIRQNSFASLTPIEIQNKPEILSATVPPDETPAGNHLLLPTKRGALPSIPFNAHGLYTNGDRSTYKIALTFDLCQSEGDLSGYDSGIIRVLSETNTPATFFLGGQWIRDHATETMELANNPLFELGNHSWSHPDFSVISPEEMQQEILLTQQIMFDLLGYQTNIFRLPYGTYNEKALNVIWANGLYVIQWDIESGDPDPGIDAQHMTNWVLQQVQPGSIIIMHANGRGWHTAEALPAIIESIRQQGYTLVTVTELLGIQSLKQATP